jgi:hypothetical protein
MCIRSNTRNLASLEMLTRSQMHDHEIVNKAHGVAYATLPSRNISIPGTCAKIEVPQGIGVYSLVLGEGTLGCKAFGAQFHILRLNANVEDLSHVTIKGPRNASALVRVEIEIERRQFGDVQSRSRRAGTCRGAEGRPARLDGGWGVVGLGQFRCSGVVTKGKRQKITHRPRRHQHRLLNRPHRNGLHVVVRPMERRRLRLRRWKKKSQRELVLALR